MGWVTTEMEDNYGQIKHDTVFMPVSHAEAIDHSRATDLLDLERAPVFKMYGLPKLIELERRKSPAST